MSIPVAILATALSLTSTNNYVYTKPINVEIAGSAAFGSDSLVRGEDVSFALEAAKERSAALRYVSTNVAYDASAVIASKLNEAVGIKTNLLQSSGSSAFIRHDAELPNTIVLDSDDPFGSFLEAVGLVAATNVSGVAVSAGSPLSMSAVASLPTGFDKLTRIAFWNDGQTDSSGYQYIVKAEYSGEPSNAFDEETGELTPGTLPTNTTSGDTVRGIQAILGSLSITIHGSKGRQQVWICDYNDQGHLNWFKHSSASTGPMFETGTSKYSVAHGAQAFCPGNAARDSAREVTARRVYAICDYSHHVGTEEIKSGTVAIYLTATLDYSYGESHVGYLPRVAITAYGTDMLFDSTLEALDENRITTSSVGGRISTPGEPGYPAAYPENPGMFAETSASTGASESQEVLVRSFIVVLDFDFNAKTL